MSASALLEVLELIQPFFYAGVALVAFVQWRQHPGRAGAWLCGSFAVLGIVLVAGRLLPQESADPIVLWARKAMVALLVLFPYFLYRFTQLFVRPIPWIKIAARVLTIGVALAALLLPSFPEEGEPRPGWVELYIGALLIQWLFLTGFVVVRLWRAGHGQPSVARRRMRTMSLGAAGLALALVVAGEFSDGGASALIVQLLATLAAPLMLVGFAPPSALRAWWRRHEDVFVEEAKLSLMEATTTAQVAEILLPHVRRLLGGPAATLENASGDIIASDGPSDAKELRSSGVAQTDHEADDLVQEGATVNIPMRSHRLTVLTSSFTPFFGREETAAAADLAALADLALVRNSLLEDQQRLAAIVESSNDAITVKSLEGTITSWNQGAERIYGYRSDEVIGKSVSILVPPDIDDDVPTILAKIRSGESVDHYETKRQTKAGDVIDVSMSVSPLRDNSGTIVGASVIGRDITESVRLRANLEEQAQMLDLAQDAIMARKLSGVITYWNVAAEERYGWSKAEALGRDVHDLLRTRFPGSREEIDADLLRKARWEGELVHTTRHGEELVVASRWALRRDKEGEPLEVLEVNNDITAQKAAEAGLHEARDQADQANRAKSEFLSRMSHELRTPLNAILGFAQLLEMDDLSSDQRDSTEQIVKGGNRLLSLINEVLDIARIESGALRLSLEPVLIGEVIGDAVELIRPLANERGILLRTDINAMEQAHVIADQQRFGQVLLNLLSNAVKYNVEKGTVSVTAERVDAARLRVGITDTGPGIPAEQIPELFTPFERLGAEQGDVEGSGLGLALSKSLVQAMGGTVEVDTMTGHGTTFWVTLKSSDAPLPETVAPADARVPSSGPGGMILYIEDNLSNLKLIERIISHRTAGELIPAMTGTLGIDLAQQHRPDLVLLDLHLPDVRGDEVLIRLRKDPRTKSIPIVILSADATPGEIERLRAAGADDYLTKPIDVVAFLALLDRFLGPGKSHA